MNHRMIFRMAIKAAGLFILVQALPQVVNEVAYHIDWAISVAHGALGRYDWIYRLRSLTIIGFLVGCGLYLLLGGTWLVNKCVPLGALCEACGYNISHCTGDRCPECGSKLPGRFEEPSS